MEATTTTALHTQLRQWARGMTTTTAATELLIRTGYARAGYRWIRMEDPDRPWIDFEFLPDQIGALSGGQQRVLRIAASIASSTPIALGDEISGLDYNYAQLVVAAIAQAAGYGAPITVPHIVDGAVVTVTKPALFSWPEE